ncbi:helix-turn-helix transcriptional regulator [uncultured Rhodospira sp.]|uniref:helix-turn-helix domain-containing protein n=1 Tax=uncultured Rhodospira sp. TaxID=1936189 RepID=UPI002612D888|nr:helix-turn-helix transcriptional regulator [uncultured Rhodospira sp.]
MTDTVTIPRAEYEAMQARMADWNDRLDLAVIEERRAEPTLPLADVERLLAGEHPVRVWRQSRGLSTEALAATAGLTPAAVETIEQGHASATVADAQALARALGVTLDTLFGA